MTADPEAREALLSLARLGASFQHLEGLGIVERHNGNLKECTTTRCTKARATLALAALPDSGAGREGLRCGDHPKFDTRLSGVGCGGPLTANETYRCAQCDTAFHRECIYQHFGWPEAGGGPMPHDLDRAIAALGAAQHPKESHRD